MEDSKGNHWSLTCSDRTNHSSKQIDVQPACRMRNGGVESWILSVACEFSSLASIGRLIAKRCPYKVITMAQSRDARIEFIPFRTNWRHSFGDRSVEMSQEPCLRLNSTLTTWYCAGYCWKLTIVCAYWEATQAVCPLVTYYLIPTIMVLAKTAQRADYTAYAYRIH